MANPDDSEETREDGKNNPEDSVHTQLLGIWKQPSGCMVRIGSARCFTLIFSGRRVCGVEV
jgi:hypothetical protein